MFFFSGEMRVDTSLIEELAGDEFENPTGDLDDDFVLQASGGELPVLHPPVPFTSKKNEFREKCACSDDYSDDEMEYSMLLIVIFHVIWVFRCVYFGFLIERTFFCIESFGLLSELFLCFLITGCNIFYLFFQIRTMKMIKLMTISCRVKIGP